MTGPVLDQHSVPVWDALSFVRREAEFVDSIDECRQLGVPGHLDSTLDVVRTDVGDALGVAQFVLNRILTAVTHHVLDQKLHRLGGHDPLQRSAVG